MRKSGHTDKMKRKNGTGEQKTMLKINETYPYVYETHLHTSACSACSRSTAKEMVNAAKKAGLSGIIITNHFYHGNSAVDRRLSWKEFAGAYRDDFLTAQEEGEKIGIDVLFGIEEGYTDGKEVLIYGISPDAVVNTPEMLNMSLPELCDFVHENGGLLYHAHPFRCRDYIPEPYSTPDMRYFDGIEVYNQFNTPLTNRMARDFAVKNNLSVIAGGDVHFVDDLGRTGLVFEKRLGSSAELVNELRSGNYRLFYEDRIIKPSEI